MTSVAAPPPAARRPRHRRRTGSVRTWVMLAVATAISLVLPTLVAKAARTIANSTEGRSITISDVVVPRAELPVTPGALVVSVDDAGEAVGFTVLAVAPSGAGGTLVVLPAGTQGTLPGQLTSGRLAGAYTTGGLADQVTAIEGFLGVTFGQVAALREADLARLLAPLAPLPVEFDTDVIGPGPDGRAVVLQAVGRHDLTAAEAAEVLTARMPNESEIVRLPHVTAVWQAVAQASSRGTAPATTSPSSTVPVAPGDVAAYLASVTSGPATARLVEAAPVLDKVNNPEGQDLLFVDPPGVRLLMAQVLPSAVSPSNGNIRVRIVNPTGDPTLSYEAVARLIYLGANVVLVNDAPGPAAAATVVEVQRPEDAEAASRYGPYLGGATTEQSDVKIDGIDATIVLGSGFASFVAEEKAKATTTTTSTTTTSTTAAPPTTAKKKKSTTTATTTKKKKKGTG